MDFHIESQCNEYRRTLADYLKPSKPGKEVVEPRQDADEDDKYLGVSSKMKDISIECQEPNRPELIRLGTASQEVTGLSHTQADLSNNVHRSDRKRVASQHARNRGMSPP
jgi:hypothetical protein